MMIVRLNRHDAKALYTDIGGDLLTIPKGSRVVMTMSISI